MKTTRLKHSLHLLGLLATLIVLNAAIAGAQTLEIPAPSSQSQPPLHYRSNPAPQPTPQASRPEPREAPISPPSHQIEPVLPAIFRGCWQGRVSELDSIQRLPGGAKLGTWTPKTYRLCYQRVGDAPFDLTFTEAGISRDRRITNATGRMQSLTTDGRTYAAMRAFLHFDEYHRHERYFGGGTFSVDEVTNLQCDIETDGMHVWGQVVGHRDGTPWFRAGWHTVFVHAPDSGGSAAGIPE